MATPVAPRILGHAVRSMGIVVLPLTIAGLDVRQPMELAALVVGVVLTRIYAALTMGVLVA